jgi:glucosamine--fructose-6-phosphate aminotransferase (isomerizing)
VTVIEQDIVSTPAILRQVIQRVSEQGTSVRPWLTGPVAFLGCGSSYCIACAAATLYEEATGNPAQGILASEYRPRAGWSHVAISRTGKTSELVEAMQRARSAGLRVMLLGGEPGSPAEAQADVTLPLEFAPEDGIVQTRFISAATLALRLLIDGDDFSALPDHIAEALASFDSSSLLPFGHVVFVGRGWRHGLAMSAALNLQETALMVPEAHHTLDYRHGPIACADERSLVWCLDDPDDNASAAVLDEVRVTGATVRSTGNDPQVELALAQLYAARRAVANGVDPDAPRNLSRAIVLPTS